MSTKKSSDIKTLKYILNLKSVSLSTNSSKPRPELIESDSVLINWGLLSGEYKNDGSVKTAKFGKILQILTILFLGYYTIKLLILMFINDNSITLIYIGDVAVIFMNMCPRIYFNTFWFTISLKAFFISIYYFVNQNNGKLCWLETTQLTKGIVVKE
jgi:hypothetical protein